MRSAVYAALMTCDPEAKLQQVAALSACDAGELAHANKPAKPVSQPGRPDAPRLVSPKKLPRRGLGSEVGRVALIHAIAHIEFNAINLGLDAAYRFQGMPEDYYRDWIRVTADETRHFQLLQTRLQQLGHEYGDFDAHDGLWEMAVKTAHDVLVRMALVPRVLEARGLDVTPGMITRLQQAGDHESVEILETILQEEIPHVAIGSHWFRYCCEQRGVAPDNCFTALLEEYMGSGLKGPFNEAARLQAGFNAAEMAYLLKGTSTRSSKHK